MTLPAVSAAKAVPKVRQTDEIMSDLSILVRLSAIKMRTRNAYRGHILSHKYKRAADFDHILTLVSTVGRAGAGSVM